MSVTVAEIAEVRASGVRNRRSPRTMLTASSSHGAKTGGRRTSLERRNDDDDDDDAAAASTATAKTAKAAKASADSGKLAAAPQLLLVAFHRCRPRISRRFRHYPPVSIFAHRQVSSKKIEDVHIVLLWAWTFSCSTLSIRPADGLDYCCYFSVQNTVMFFEIYLAWFNFYISFDGIVIFIIS